MNKLQNLSKTVNVDHLDSSFIHFCQVIGTMCLFVERPVASLWRRDAKAGVGPGRKVQVDNEKFKAQKASKGTSYLFRCVIGYWGHAVWSLLCFMGPRQKLQI